MNILGPYAIEQDYSHYVSKMSGIIFGVVGTATKGAVNTPTLCTSTTDFLRKFGPASADHLGMYAALYYLNNGNRLYFVRAEGTTPAAKATATIKGKKLTPDTYTVTGGTDSATGLQSAQWIKAVDTLKSDVYDINLFAVPGVSDNAVILECLDVAEYRGDCLFLVDPPNNLTPDQVKDWHNGTGEYSSTSSLLNSSYGAVYYSWQTVYDKDTDSYIDLPPSAIVSSVMAKSARETEIWMPPAGMVRGLVSGVNSPKYSPDTGERNALYADQNAVNCIIEDPTYGLVVFGQKTLLRANTALDRVNVRMLLNYLKRVVVAAAKYLTFEPNDSTTWNSFEDLVEPTLRSIGQRRGLYDYKIVKGEAIVTNDDIDNYRMPCKILIQPTKAAEEIPIYFTLTSTGVDFNEILESESLIEA